MPIRAIVFDFDGLILDTETPELVAWQEIFREYGCELPIDVWADCIGRPSGYFDTCSYLEKLSGRTIDHEATKARRRARSQELMEQEGAMPGVEDYLHQARALGLKTAIASSSSSGWVVGHLKRLGLDSLFDSFTCSEHTSNHKPNPEPYLCALRSLGIPPADAFALEDSPNGVTAAKAAGLFCVAVPNPVTGRLDLSHADLIIPSLKEKPLEELIRHIEQKADRAST